MTKSYLYTKPAQFQMKEHIQVSQVPPQAASLLLPKLRDQEMPRIRQCPSLQAVIHGLRAAKEMQGLSGMATKNPGCG